MTHDLQSTGGDHSDQAAQPVRARRSRRPVVLAGGVLVLIAALALALVPHLTSGQSSTGRETTGQSASTTTATPIPRVLYQADWTHGAGAWTLPADWHLVDGHIQNDGNGTEPLMVPYYVTLPDYSIEADLTVQNVPNSQTCHSYGIQGLDGAGNEQFLGQIACIGTGTATKAITNHGFSENLVTHADSAADSMSTQDYIVSHSLVTFVVQVQDKNVGFCPGASCLSNVNSLIPLWPMHIAIEDIGVQLTLTRLVITSP